MVGGQRSCSVILDHVTVADHGQYMCLLNQADVFHTDRRYVSLEVATPAMLSLGRKIEYDLLNLEGIEEVEILSLVEGEEVEVECEAWEAYPKVQFVWSIPGSDHNIVPSEEHIRDDDNHFIRSRSTVKISARTSDHGEIIKCSTVQTTESGQILYKVTSNLTLHVTKPAPLLATRSSHVGILTGGLLALILVIIIVSVMIFVCKKKKRINSSKERVNNKIGAAETKDVEQIWVTKSSKSHPHHGSSDSELQCTAEIHNSSSSSNTSSSASTASSHEILSADNSLEAPKHSNDDKLQPSQGEYISYSPAYMYSSYEATQMNPGPYKSYKPRGLGQFDPSTDVHSITRPNTGNSLLSSFQCPSNVSGTSADTVQMSTAPMFPSRPRQIKLYSGEPVCVGDPVGQGIGHGHPSWDDGASVASVFDCHHGCFTPDPSEISSDETKNVENEENSKPTNPEPTTPGSIQETRSAKSILGLGASNHSLVPVNIPIDITNEDTEADYTEMYHTSMGHLYTVKTKDMEL